MLEDVGFRVWGSWFGASETKALGYEYWGHSSKTAGICSVEQRFEVPC